MKVWSGGAPRSRDFLRLTGIALLVALPLSWWAASAWLQDFAYRASLSLWVFAMAALFTLALTLFTVGIKAFAAARLNPVRNLRAE